MKDELDYKSCETFEEQRFKIEEYMQYYNQVRKQWKEKKMTPVECRNHLLARVQGLNSLIAKWGADQKSRVV